MMMQMPPKLAVWDRRITRWMAEHGVLFLRVSIGIVFVWFGGLKFFPGLSSADQLATDTINQLTFGLISGDIARMLADATVERFDNWNA